MLIQDIDNILLEGGIITIYGMINEEVAELFFKQFSILAMREDLREIGVIINSSGGYLSSALSITNLIEASSTPVKTVCVHTAKSGGLLVLMSGDYRMVTHNASLMSHRYRGGKIGDHEDLVAIRKQEDWDHKSMIDFYIRRSNLNTKEEVEKFLLKESETHLTPRQALKYGLIDRVLKQKKQPFPDETECKK